MCLARSAGAAEGVSSTSPVGPIPPSPSSYTPPDTVSAVRDLYRRMSVPVRVNGQGPFPFVVDTGANRTVISRELATQLGLPVGSPASVNGVAGIQMALTTSARLDVGARHHLDAPLLIFPQDDIGGPGLLGLDDLDGQAVTLDFRLQTLRVEPGRQLAMDARAITLGARRRSGQLTFVDAALDGQRLTAFMDTGADSTIGNLALRAKAANREPDRLSFHTSIMSATGQTIEGEIADLPRLRIGRLTLSTWPVTFADLHTFRMWNMIDKPALLLGVDVLSRFDYVCLDFARNQVRFRLPQTT